MNKKIWKQQVNFIASVALIGSAALLAIVLMLQEAEMENPIAGVIADTVYAESVK